MLKMGSDPVKLMARIHLGCELHMWLEGEHRGFVADLITEGLEQNMFRGGMGWEQAIEWLLNDEGMVVFSYSVTPAFPDAAEVYEHENWSYTWEEFADEIFWRWSYEKQWERGVAALRATKPDLQLTPDNLHMIEYFSNQRDLFDLMAMMREKPGCDSA
jgi:hypothetical protein